MSDSTLEATLEEILPLDATPKQVLTSLKTLNERVAEHQKNEPGKYSITEPVAVWRTTLRSSWVLSVTLFRSIPEVTPEPIKATPKT